MLAIVILQISSRVCIGAFMFKLSMKQTRVELRAIYILRGVIIAHCI